MKWAVLAALLLARPALASEEMSPTFYTGNDLKSLCENTATGLRQCTSYIMGVFDGLRYMAILQGKEFCVPFENFTGGQLKDVVLMSLNAKPAERHLGAASLVFSALVTAFPCPAK